MRFVCDLAQMLKGGFLKLTLDQYTVAVLWGPPNELMEAGHADDSQIDPIIAEVRANRDGYAARFNYDVTAIFQDIRSRQKASGREYVSYPARHPPESQDRKDRP